LRFTPYARAKLEYIRDIGHTEISGFGLSDPHDALLVRDFQMIKQVNTTTHTEFDDDDFSRYLSEMSMKGFSLDQFARIWIHTHPHGVNGPSGTDENTFRDKFGTYPFSVMYILTRGGFEYCRLQFNHKDILRSSSIIPTEVDFHQAFPKSNKKAWKKEYDKYCEEEVYAPSTYYMYKGERVPYERKAPWQQETVKARIANARTALTAAKEAQDAQDQIRQSQLLRAAHKDVVSLDPTGPADSTLDELDLLRDVDIAVFAFDIIDTVMGYEETQDVVLENDPVLDDHTVGLE